MPLKDPRATQMGGLCGSVIGHDVTVIEKAVPGGFTADTQVNVPVIGTPGSQQVEAVGYAGKALRYEVATGAHVANAAVGASTYLNRTGTTLASGNVVLATAP